MPLSEAALLSHRQPMSLPVVENGFHCLILSGEIGLPTPSKCFRRVGHCKRREPSMPLPSSLSLRFGCLGQFYTEMEQIVSLDASGRNQMQSPFPSSCLMISFLT